MSLEVHHLHLSQSERVVWLLEELQIPYDLHVHLRDPTTALAPAALKGLNPFGTAPYFRDTKVSPVVELSESGAIVEYILAAYGPTSTALPRPLSRAPGDKDYGPYLQWLHYANATLQPALSRSMMFMLMGVKAHAGSLAAMLEQRNYASLQLLDERLAGSRFLAGEELSAADIMTVFTITTGRGFFPFFDLTPYTHVLRYLRDIAARPGYQAAVKKGDFGMEPLIGATVEGFTQFPAFAKAVAEYK